MVSYMLHLKYSPGTSCGTILSGTHEKLNFIKIDGSHGTSSFVITFIVVVPFIIFYCSILALVNCVPNVVWFLTVFFSFPFSFIGFFRSYFLSSTSFSFILVVFFSYFTLAFTRFSVYMLAVNELNTAKKQAKKKHIHKHTKWPYWRINLQ